MHEDTELSALKDKALYLLGCTVIALGGVVIGVWSSRIEDSFGEIRDGQRLIWQTLNDRASLPQRTATLEQRAEDQERRLRELERRR